MMKSWVVDRVVKPVRVIDNWIVDLRVKLEHTLFELITYSVDFGLPNLLFLLLLI